MFNTLANNIDPNTRAWLMWVLLLILAVVLVFIGFLLLQWRRRWRRLNADQARRDAARSPQTDPWTEAGRRARIEESDAHGTDG